MTRTATVAILVLATVTVSVTHARQSRDTRLAAEPAGTSRISGIVVSDENPERPVARAIVTVSGGGLTLGRTSVTGADGRFAFGNLPAGDFTIRAVKPAHITAVYGATRPGRPGTPLTVTPGQSADVQIRLARGAVIAGTVRHARGEAAAGVAIDVVPVPRVRLPGSQNVIPTTAMTDERGTFRAFGLLPGDYLVAAIPPRPGFSSSAGLPGMEMRGLGNNNILRRSASEIDAILRTLQSGAAALPGPAAPRSAEPADAPQTYGFAPVYFPGSVSPSQATKITVRQGEAREGVDITIDLVKTTTVTGIITSAHGPLPATGLSIQAADERPHGAPLAAPVLSKSPAQDGRFEYSGLTPGRYVIWARSREGAPAAPTSVAGGGVIGGGVPAAGPGSLLWAMAEINATGEPITGLTLALQPTLRVAGSVVFDASTQEPPKDLTALRLTITSETAPFGGMGNQTNFGGIPIPAAQVQADGTFAFTGVVPGVYRLAAVLPGSSAWWQRSAKLGDRDLFDLPLEIGMSGETRPLIITFSDRQTELAGSLRASEGTPAPDFFVVVFPADRSLWRPLARRVQVVRPATNGGFAIRGLPAGDYLLGALRDMDPSDVHDAAFLEQVAAAAIKVSLKEGEQKRQDIQIAK